MNETTTVLIVAVAGIGLFLLYQSMQQQAAVQNAILLKLATPAPAASSNPLDSVLKLAGPILGAIL